MLAGRSIWKVRCFPTLLLRWIGPSVVIELTLHFALSSQIKSNPPQDVEVIGVNDKGQLGDHILVSGMIPVSLWSSQF